MTNTNPLTKSPYYQGVVERYGKRITEDAARRILSDHGQSFESMREADEEIKFTGGKTSALHLLIALGY